MSYPRPPPSWIGVTPSLRRQPFSTLLVIAALSLGAAATITLFAFFNAVFLAPLPYEEPHELVWLQESHADIPARRISYPNFLDWQARNRTFEAMASFRELRAAFSLGERGRAVDARVVGASYFRVLGIRPELGRDFTAAENEYGAPRVAIVSHGLWQSELSGRADAIGTDVLIDGERHTVVGVAPASPAAPGNPDVWVLAGQRAAPNGPWTERSNRIAGYVIGRLRPGVTVAQASADMRRIGDELAREYRFNGGHVIEVLPLREALYGNLRLPVLVSFGAVAVLLAIVCVNASNLLLIRAAERRAEFALRAALGAGTRRIVGHVLAESVLLAGLGTGLGMLLATAGTEALAASLPADLLNGAEPAVGLPVFLFSLALMLGMGLVTGLPPALRAAAADLREALGAGGRATRGGGTLRDALAVLQIALALTLLVCAALLLESMTRIGRYDHGFDPEGMLTFRVLAAPAADTSALVRLQARLLERIESLPSVESAALAQELPGREPRWQTDINPESELAARRAPGELINVDWAAVSGRYFDTLRIRIESGRAITEKEAAEGAPVMLIDEGLARRFWPKGDAIGKHIKYDSPEPIEIVGVAAEVRALGRQLEPRIKIYTPYGRLPLRDVAVMVRTKGIAPLALAPQVREAVQALDPGIGVYDVSTLASELADYLAPRTVTARMVTLFAVLAASLAALGIYGVVTYATLQRSRELAIRAALGARPESLVRLLLGKGIALTAAGIAIGIAGASAAARALSTLLFGIGAASPGPYVAAAGLFTVVALVAFVTPASRVRKTDPALVMRSG